MDNEFRTMSEWERDWRTSPLRAYVHTFQAILKSPVRYFSSITPMEDYVGIAVLIYFNAFLVLFFSIILQVVFKFSFLPLILTQLNVPLMALGSMMAVFFNLAAAFVLPLLAVFFMMLFAGVMHFFFDVIGGTEKKYNTTLTVYALSSLVQLLSIVPVLGALATLFYQLIIHIGGQAAAHEISVPKALLSWLMPVLICCCCFGGMMMTGVGLSSFLQSH